jgi:hypothetical protein
MKNKVYESFEKAIDDVFDGVAITHSMSSTAGQAVNLCEVLSLKVVRDLTIVGDMFQPRQPTFDGTHLPILGPINCIL